MLEWTQKHVPVSVSICSNVENNKEPFCIVEQDQDKLVQQMVAAMKCIANRVYELADEKWGWVLEEIDERLRHAETVDFDIAEEEKDDNDGDDNSDATRDQTEKRHPLKTLYGQFEKYMSQVPVLGFNSAKYDLNLVKRCLAKHLSMHDPKNKDAFVVKKSNAYACIVTEQLKFLDISQFLAAGCSYSSFLKAYQVKEQKGCFPYEWFDDYSKLEAPSLPAHADFYSSLKASNISEEDYRYCQNIWKDQKMSTFRQFLVWYNNLDVGPFVTAVERFQAFYFEKGIDVFKTAISVPGIARQLLFKTARAQNVNFVLFDQNNKDLYQTIKQNIVGGPSIIFTRHHCAGKTLIRGQKKCGSILGFDANALYLHSIGKPMPVGPFIRRRSENDFRPELRDKYLSAYYWMEWVMHTRHVNIQHRLNSGREVRVGKYPVDGYMPATTPEEKPTVFQFHGCYFHGHVCEVTRGVSDDNWQATRAQKYGKTQETTTYLKREHHVVEMWECEFGQYCSKHPQIYAFIDSMRPGFFRDHKGKITENHILEGVITENLFGMVEVDIEVPSQWPWYFQSPTLTPYEYFREMSPLFCSTDIPYEAMGSHMQRHVDHYNLSTNPRRLLVGGMKGKQLLIATPLLRWYLNHGMVVTKIYQVVEFQKERCFKDFEREVSDARRLGDKDPDTAIIADTNKVIGNAGYGSLIMDKTRHRDVNYFQGENETCLKVNDPRFQKLDCLDPEQQYYEIEMAKKNIKLDLPIQLGYFVLQYAKLRMLEFYFDFMDVYVDRTDFEYCEMDTDSAYMAISGSCLDDIIKPELIGKYQEGLTGFCNDDEVEADAQYHWFPRTCCIKHAKYDKRTPGLFKLEYQGDEMIGLCSKTYIVRKSKTKRPSSSRIVAFKLLQRSLPNKRKRCPLRSMIFNEYKFSSKGVSKRTVKAPMTKFRHVLKSRKAQSGQNRGFRVRNNSIYTYTQKRRGFSYFYCKRKVLEDGIHTEPLDITLSPFPKKDTEVKDQELVDILVELLEANE